MKKNTEKKDEKKSNKTIILSGGITNKYKAPANTKKEKE